MRLILLFLVLSFSAPMIAHSQLNCFQYSNSIFSCDGPRGSNTTTVPFSNHAGIITQRDEGGSTMSPYTIMPAPEPHSRDLNHAITPLEPLPSLRSFEPGSSFDREEPVFAPYLRY